MEAIINLPEDVQPKIRYIWALLLSRLDLNTETIPKSQISIGLSNQNDIQISKAISDLRKDLRDSFPILNDNNPLLKTESGNPDYLGTAFYMINCLQEFNAPASSYDQYDRFKPECTYQHKMANFQDNVVEDLFRALIKSSPALQGTMLKNEPSKVFLSHDIDIINAAVFQEGKAALLNGNLLLLLKIIFNYFISGPSYRDMDRIMDIHDEYDVKSTFFWMVEKGKKVKQSSGVSIPQSDYDISNAKIESQIRNIISRGFEIGLHKSTTEKSFNEELSILEEYTLANRNHYLHYYLPDHFDAIEESDIKLDFSMGFGSQFGFRNSYGKPFIPFNLDANIPYSFLEVPLQIMDTTFKYYQRKTPQQAKADILDFLSRHKENCTISILWHNDMFSPIKNPGWLDLYKTILDFCRQMGIQATNQKELMQLRRKQLTFLRNSS